MAVEQPSAPQAVLLIRSSSVKHCNFLFKYLREGRHPDSSTRWIWIEQPGLEAAFCESRAGAQVESWIYDRGMFTQKNLNALFRDRLKDVSVAVAYVPVNNPDAKGYGAIIRFLHRSGIRNIQAHYPDHRFERMTSFRYVLTRVVSSLVSAVIPLILIPAVPMVILYYLLLVTGIRLRQKVSGGGGPAAVSAA